MTIRAPFNFVPLNKDVYIPDWNDKITQDIPFKEGEDGTIILKMKNLTPIFIRNGHAQGGVDDDFSAHILQNGVKKYYIPATSIKGMIRAVMEVLTFSKMNMYDDDFFGYREFNTKIPTGKKYHRSMEGEKCGWLSKIGDDYIIKPCGDPEIIEIGDVKKKFRFYKKTDKAIDKYEAFKQYAGAKYPLFNGKHLVCTGYMNNKEHEYLFAEGSNSEKLILSKSVKEAFISIYKPSSYYEYLINSLKDKDGDELPVFYHTDNGEVTSLGLTRMYRYPYSKRVSDGINQTLKDTEGRSKEYGMDMVQCIFGTIKEKDALKGRVQFGNAFTDAIIPDEQLIACKGVLGSPLASYYPFYVRQNGNTYSTYDDSKIEIAGRKRYRIHKNNYITNLPAGNGNEKTLSSLKLLPAGSTFDVQIRVHNMLPIEIGALLSAITFHNTQGVYHNLGMAKSYGYGKMEIDMNDLGLIGFKHSVKEYMTSFETDMSKFTVSCHLGKWTDSNQIKMLFSMATDHDKNLELMSLDEYKDGKINTNFDTLKEDDFTVQSLVNPEHFKRDLLKNDFIEAESLIEQHQYSAAIRKYCSLKEDLSEYDVTDIDQKIHAIENLIEKEAEDKKKEEEARKEAENAARKGKGLSAFLDALNLHGEYVVQNLKLCDAKVKKWLKDDNNRNKLNNDEIEDLTKTLIRILNNNIKEKEKKDWLDINSRVWDTISKWMEETCLKEVFDKVVNSVSH